MILGIDEAGRGPVIGPMVICGVWLTPARERDLLAEGVQDSKAFGSTTAAKKRRAALAALILRRANHQELSVIEAAEVDQRVYRGQLNQLEREQAASLILNGPRAHRIVADGQRLFGALRRQFSQLRAVDRADSSCVAVAAASIVAKVERDRLFGQIATRLEQQLEQQVTGGGYVNGGTERLLRAYVQRYGDLPAEVRRSWSWSVLEELGFGQQTLLPIK